MRRPRRRHHDARALGYLLCALTAAVVIAFCLWGCNHDHHDGILPTVSNGCVSPPIVQCHDLMGKEPPVKITRRAAEDREGYCFIHDLCFYNCPPTR